MRSDGDDRRPRTGVLLVGHGTRSELGQAECRDLAAQIAGLLEPRLFAMELAFLELASPTIDEAVARLTRQPLSCLIVVPLLLFSAGHAKDDIPRAVRGALAAAGKGNLPLVQTPPLELHPAVIDLAERRFREAAADATNLKETCLLLVGRGSRDEEATAQMQELGTILHRRLDVGQTRVGFLAMAQPSAADLLARAAESPFRQIIVQPHLLFAGELLDQLRQDVAQASKQAPHQTWRLTRILAAETGTGNASPLASLFADLATAATTRLRVSRTT